MRVLTVYAHPNPRSFCHAVLERFLQGVVDAGHTSDVIDLYAIKFNPVLTPRDFANWLPDENAPDVVEKIVNEQFRSPHAGFKERLLARTFFRGKSAMQILDWFRKRGPRDVKEQQDRVAKADVLVFIAPVWFVGFPAMLKGWIERVFSLGFAYSLNSAGWHGDIGGRIPRLKHKKALIISTTIFNKTAYDAGLREAMQKLIDEFSLHYPGIQRVEHEFLYAVNMADQPTLQKYLDRVYDLGRNI